MTGAHQPIIAIQSTDQTSFMEHQVLSMEQLQQNRLQIGVTETAVMNNYLEFWSYAQLSASELLLRS